MYRTTSLTTVPSSNDKLAAMLAHAGTCLAWFLAPLLIYALKKDDSKYAEYHALQSLLWSLAGTVVSFATCGLAIPAFLVFHILAAVRTAEGTDYEYPIVGEIARKYVYGA